MVAMLSSSVRRKVEYGVAVPMSPNRKAIVSSESSFLDTKLRVEVQPPASLPTYHREQQQPSLSQTFWGQLIYNKVTQV